MRNQDRKLSLKIRDHELGVVDTTKYLGPLIDNSLDWKYHISVLSSKAVGFLKHAKSILFLETLNKLDAGIVEPHFRYCCSLWGCCCVTKNNHLQKLQSRAARTITNISFDAPGIPFVRRLDWKTIEEPIAHESELMVFKSIHGLSPQYLAPFKRSNTSPNYFHKCWIDKRGGIQMNQHSTQHFDGDYDFEYAAKQLCV